MFWGTGCCSMVYEATIIALSTKCEALRVARYIFNGCGQNFN